MPYWNAERPATVPGAGLSWPRRPAEAPSPHQLVLILSLQCTETQNFSFRMTGSPNRGGAPPPRVQVEGARQTVSRNYYGSGLVKTVHKCPVSRLVQGASKHGAVLLQLQLWQGLTDAQEDAAIELGGCTSPFCCLAAKSLGLISALRQRSGLGCRALHLRRWHSGR
jgi:hypothetical protein